MGSINELFSLSIYSSADFFFNAILLIIYTSVLKILYIMGDLKNLHTAKKYYTSTIQLFEGKDTEVYVW